MSFIAEDQSKMVWTDEVGHGTHLTALLRKIAEYGDIYVARVFERNPKPELKSAEVIAKVSLPETYPTGSILAVSNCRGYLASPQALRHAVDNWEVDIVVMSFGFEKETPALQPLSNAIRHAVHNDVLIFAAASNDGKNHPHGVAWPAARRDVFCVHAGKGKGTASDFTPSPVGDNCIMTLGDHVSSAWPPFPEDPRRRQPGDCKVMSGTSCAAPIAAGIAAMVLDYARGFLDEEQWRRLRDYDRMMRLFQSLRDQNDRSGYWWIRHWTLLGDPDRKESWIQETISGLI